MNTGHTVPHVETAHWVDDLQKYYKRYGGTVTLCQPLTPSCDHDGLLVVRLPIQKRIHLYTFQESCMRDAGKAMFAFASEGYYDEHSPRWMAPDTSGFDYQFAMLVEESLSLPRPVDDSYSLEGFDSAVEWAAWHARMNALISTKPHAVVVTWDDKGKEWRNFPDDAWLPPQQLTQMTLPWNPPPSHLRQFAVVKADGTWTKGCDWTDSL